MALIPAFLHRRSLSIASVVLPLSFVLSAAFTPILMSLHGRDSIEDAVWLRSAIASGLALGLCGFAWFNLIRDVDRGYSPSRCSLSAFLLLVATIAPVAVLLNSLHQLSR